MNKLFYYQYLSKICINAAIKNLFSFRIPYKESSERRKQIKNESNPATYRSDHIKMLYKSKNEKVLNNSRVNQNHTARQHSPSEYENSFKGININLII